MAAAAIGGDAEAAVVDFGSRPGAGALVAVLAGCVDALAGVEQGLAVLGLGGSHCDHRRVVQALRQLHPALAVGLEDLLDL